MNTPHVGGQAHVSIYEVGSAIFPVEVMTASGLDENIGSANI